MYDRLVTYTKSLFSYKLYKSVIATILFADVPVDVLDIIVFIPSARSNIDQRTAIRETWMRSTLGNETVQSRSEY